MDRCSGEVRPGLNVHKNHLGNLLKCRNQLGISSGGLRICASGELPGDVDAAGHGPHFEQRDSRGCSQGTDYSVFSQGKDYILLECSAFFMDRKNYSLFKMQL